MINKKELIKKARNVDGFFKQEEYQISEEYRMSKLIDFVIEELQEQGQFDEEYPQG